MNPIQISQPLSGVALEIGNHFFAHSFHQRNLGDRMNPLLMVDHFWMKRSMHWMVAGAGATHCERPEDPDALVHALQIFVDLPDQLKMVPPYAIHLESQDIPEVVRGRARVRVIAGEYEGVRSPARLPQPFSFYDIFLTADASIEIPLESGWGGWFYSVSGDMTLMAQGKVSNLSQNQAIGMRTGAASSIVTLTAEQLAHVVVLAGRIVPSN